MRAACPLGEVLESEDERFRPGAQVVSLVGGPGETRDGGYAELARLDGHPGIDDAALLALRLRHERRLLTALEERPFPENLSRRKGDEIVYCGFYRSWLLAWLLASWSNPVTPGASAT